MVDFNHLEKPVVASNGDWCDRYMTFDVVSKPVSELTFIKHAVAMRIARYRRYGAEVLPIDQMIATIDPEHPNMLANPKRVIEVSELAVFYTLHLWKEEVASVKTPLYVDAAKALESELIHGLEAYEIFKQSRFDPYN